MIGVIHKADEGPIVEEFFQLFKTAWERYRIGRTYDVVIITTDDPSPANTRLVLRFCAAQAGKDDSEVRITSDLFGEVRQLLTRGQAAAQALMPTLDQRIKMVRDLILEAGIGLIEIPPIPAGYPFAVSLTHDIDFIGIRHHTFDHTMLGFLYRSSVGALRECVAGKIGLAKLLRIWKATASLPLVHLGLIKDYWIPFDWYLDVEQGLGGTYYFIPFKNRAGEKVSAPHASRRASSYGIGDIPEWIEKLKANGCEVGVHGIDAWHSAEKGREELRETIVFSKDTNPGIRMHWLLWQEDSPQILEQAGYAYDSTIGFNETPGFRAGTSQVYLPPGNRTLLELPMHIQDGALFFPQRLGLSESAAWKVCEQMIDTVRQHGGVLTLLWHDRSHGPERYWGEFYVRLIERLKDLKVWFASGKQVVTWFRARRAVAFEGATVVHTGEKVAPAFLVRVHESGKSHDIPWAGGGRLNVREFICAGEEVVAP